MAAIPHVKRDVGSGWKNSKLNCTFSVICFSETWATDNSICNNLDFQIENYTVSITITSNKSIWQRGGLSIFVQKEVNFKPCTDLYINSNDLESLYIEI